MPERSCGAQGLKAGLRKRGVIPRVGTTFKLSKDDRSADMRVGCRLTATAKSGQQLPG
jgi:hypothetical protein